MDNHAAHERVEIRDWLAANHAGQVLSAPRDVPSRGVERDAELTLDSDRGWVCPAAAARDGCATPARAAVLVMMAGSRREQEPERLAAYI
jgi:hypothetical protein